jgi:hypothetical protein
VERVGAAATIGRRGGRLGLGRGRGSRPLDRDQRPKHALPSELPTPAGKKCQKIYCFPEECLLKLQTPMPQNMKEKRKGKLTSFQKIGISQLIFDINIILHHTITSFCITLHHASYRISNNFVKKEKCSSENI